MPSSWKTSAPQDHVGRSSQNPAGFFVCLFFHFCLLCFYKKCFDACSLHCVEGNEVSVPLQTAAAALHQSVGREGMEELIYMCYSKATTV